MGTAGVPFPAFLVQINRQDSPAFLVRHAGRASRDQRRETFNQGIERNQEFFGKSGVDQALLPEMEKGGTLNHILHQPA
jgi:hypothetical protein